MASIAAPALLRRFGGFATSLVISTAINLLAIPFVISTLGGEVWGELAVAQATAAIFGIVVAFGWGTVGAALVASLQPDQRPQMFLNSLISRCYLFLFSAPVMFVVVSLLSSFDPLAAAVASIAYLLPFLGASWYFIGQARPWQLLVCDVLPQGLGTVTGVILIQFAPHPLAFASCLLAFNLLAVVAGGLGALRRKRDTHPPLVLNLSLRSAIHRLREQKHGVIAAGSGSLNTNLPMIAVNLVVVAALPQYALADKLFRFAVAGFGPVLQVIQGWIPEAGPANTTHRIRRVATLAPAVGLLGGLILALLVPWASSLFSRGEILVGFSLSVPFGLVLAAVVVAQIIGLACLIPLGKGAALATSTTVGAAVNVPLMFVLGVAFGAPGVAWAVALSEVLVAGYQISVVRQTLRNLAEKPAG